MAVVTDVCVQCCVTLSMWDALCFYNPYHLCAFKVTPVDTRDALCYNIYVDESSMINFYWVFFA